MSTTARNLWPSIQYSVEVPESAGSTAAVASLLQDTTQLTNILNAAAVPGTPTISNVNAVATRITSTDEPLSYPPSDSGSDTGAIVAVCIAAAVIVSVVILTTNKSVTPQQQDSSVDVESASERYNTNKEDTERKAALQKRLGSLQASAADLTARAQNNA